MLFFRQLILSRRADVLFHTFLAHSEFAVVLSALAQRKPVISPGRHVKQLIIGDHTVNADSFDLSVFDNDICVVLPEAHRTDVISAAFV